ncbi:MAG: DUF6178 family protein [Myxococcales bacterium]|nr:DUF6178 family protein [Myxococcota bacterium]MDW8282933.1 DUF6178 family protein [Myxococcales bacterium]
MAPSKPTSDPGQNNLVALHRPPLERPRRPLQWLDDLLSRPDARAVVQAMPEQEFYLAIRELGLADALDLLRLGTPEQIQTCLDIEGWNKDRVSPQRLMPWFEALLELGPERLGRIVEALDHELVVSFLHPQVRVYDLSCDQVPEEPEGHLYQTPDRFYVIETLGENGQTVERLIDALYTADLDLGRRVVMGLRWDAGAETEEQAYRFRSARMADLGYLDYYDALRIYTYLDPHSVSPTEQTATPVSPAPSRVGLIPTEISESLADSLLSRALRLLDDPERDQLMHGLLFVLNQALSADRVDPADLEGARAVMQRAAGYLSMALEYLVRPTAADKPTAHSSEEHFTMAGSVEMRAVEVLRRVALQRLFRLGYSLTLQLARLASILSARGLVTLLPGKDPASLLDPPLDEVIRLLTPPARPLFSRQLEGGLPGGRPFRTLADVSRTAHALDEVRALSEFLTTGLGVRSDTLRSVLSGRSPPPGQIRLTDLLGTLVANLLLRRPPALVPLHRSDLLPLRQAALGLGESGPVLSPAAQQAVYETLRARVAERSLNATEAQALWPPAVDRFVEQTLRRLGEGLAALPARLSPAEADVVPSVQGIVLDR